DDHEGMGEIAFEEQRLRSQTEQPPHPSPADCPTSRTPAQEVAAAYQAFRLRQGEEDANAVDRWCRSFRGNSVHAELFRDMHRSDPEAASRLARAVSTLPDMGTDFLGFRLVTELGRGSFSRVYLAQQGELANRLVALKVSTDLLGEPATLAQLQHTH